MRKKSFHIFSNRPSPWHYSKCCFESEIPLVFPLSSFPDKNISAIGISKSTNPFQVFIPPFDFIFYILTFGHCPNLNFKDQSIEFRSMVRTGKVGNIRRNGAYCIVYNTQRFLVPGMRGQYEPEYPLITSSSAPLAQKG